MIRETLKDVLGITNMPKDLADYHTAIGYLPWSIAHVRAQSENPAKVWGGVFCLSIDQFQRELADQFTTFGLTTASLLGESVRLDLRLINGFWQAFSRDARGGHNWQAETGYSIIAEMPKTEKQFGRFDFFYRNQKTGSGNHLDILNDAYLPTFYRHPEKPNFWTFDRKPNVT